MEELPQLPFDRILSHLSFVELVKSRAVSRRWYNHINNFKVKTLLLFHRSGWLAYRKNILRDATQSYAISTELETFFNKFGPTILSNLRQLRLFYPGPSAMSLPVLVKSLQMLDKLEELAITGYPVQPNEHQKTFMYGRLELRLPMLKSIRLESLVEIEKLNLVAPKLQNVQIADCFLSLNFVHRESIEKLIICHLECVTMKQLKSMKQLKCLHINRSASRSIDSTFLSGRKQLREIHLFHTPYEQQRSTILQLFDQKQRYGCVDLKIFFRGLLLDGPDDPAIGDDHMRFNVRNLDYLAENHLKMANEMPFYIELSYDRIKHISPESKIELLKRLTDLEEVEVTRSIQNVQSFLYFLDYFDYIDKKEALPILSFYRKQPQDMFRRLPEHCIVWRLKIRKAPSDDLLSLKVLKNLAFLHINCPIELRTVQKILEKLLFLFQFKFKMGEKRMRIVMEPPANFQLWINKARADDPDLTELIRSILEKRQKGSG